MALNRSSQWLCLCVVFALCFTLRVGVGGVIDATVPVIKRADVYSDIAVNLARGHGFVAEAGGEPIIWRAPLYPAFLAAVYALFGEYNGTAVFLAQTALDSISAVLIFWMGTRLFGESVGFFSAVVFALHPISAYYSLRFMPEPLFTLAFVATTAAWLAAAQSLRPSVFAAVGALVAVAALAKPVALGLWPFLVGCALYRMRNEPRRGMTAAMVLTIACLLVLGPWAIRNYRVTGHVVAVATGGGYALWLGNQIVSQGQEDWEVDDVTRANLTELRDAVFAQAEVSPYRVPQALNSKMIRSFVQPVNIRVEEDRAFLHAAWREIASHPFDSVMLLVRKFFRFWFSIFHPENRWAQSYIVIFQTLFLAFAVLGMMEVKRRRGILFLLLPPVIFLTVIHAVTFATIRYSLPALAILTIFMSAGVREVVRALNKKFGMSVGVSLVRSVQAIPLGKTGLSYRRRRL
ncbi:MAG: glycosyltransferase family 39 protein [Nitrospira defluvii]|nr:glycosyltransferase family 39 protein [Nitrospira defluvii]